MAVWVTVTTTPQGCKKWVNLLDHMLHIFKGNGHCVTMDSAYMGNIMAMIGRNVWKINMVGMAQTNRTGADVANKISWMKKGMYKSICWQHKMRPLCFVVWLNNALVKTCPIFTDKKFLRRAWVCFGRRGTAMGRGKGTRQKCHAHLRRKIIVKLFT
jgi:hypothetical protein